jgi:hypothetical protein
MPVEIYASTIMKSSKSGFLTFLSWLSLAVPCFAFCLCYAAYSAPYPWISWISGFRAGAVTLTWHGAFLIAGLIGVIALFGDIRFRRWRLVWLPVAGLILGVVLYVLASGFTCIL